MRPGHFDHAKTGAAQGRVYADNNLRPRRPGAKAALKNGLREAPGTAQARFELLELAGCDGHGGFCCGVVEFSVFKAELKTIIASLAILLPFTRLASGAGLGLMFARPMPAQSKILLVDDDEQMLELYQALLEEVPSHPEVQVCNTGARAIAMLESEPFTLLITDLRMPKMDGLQVLAIVRRKFPQLRIVVLTGVLDEEYRSRAYAQGVEMFWQKPSSTEDIQLFQDCIESMLDRSTREPEGFRGVQSKSLVDLIQLECLSRSSSILSITRGGLRGKIWIINGEIMDAATAGMTGEAAFREILSWRSGNFEILPADPARPRAIHSSYQGLLLDTAQALDESKGPAPGTEPEAAGQTPGGAPAGLAALGRFEGVGFVLSIPPDDKAPVDSWSLENPMDTAHWARDTHRRLAQLGDVLRAGELTGVFGFGWEEHWALAAQAQKGLLCAGFRPGLRAEQVEQTMKHLVDKWAS
jgi:CheY-like chemotaxis protein